MGVRFRKSIKIANGVKLNLGKKSVGLSFGGKGFRYSVNTSGRKTTSIGIPGTGLSYVSTKGRGKSRQIHTNKTNVADKSYSQLKKEMKTGFIPMILTIFLGWSGIQWFVSGRTGMGFLYLFTMGLFGIGWFVDIIKQIVSFIKFILNRDKLLTWQNKLLEEPVHSLIMTEQQLKLRTQERLENDIRIIGDSVKIVENTKNPDTFFERLALLEQKANDMRELENYAEFENAKPSEAMREFTEKKQQCIAEFLTRYLRETLGHADNLKTDKGKMNQYQKFYNSLQPYYIQMDADNINYVETRYKAYTESLKEGH